MVDTQRPEIEQFDYLLAVMWGDKRTKVIDFFGYSDVQDWPGNPDVSSWVLRDGVFMHKKNLTRGDTTCGDSLIMLGEEERYRRTRANLSDYMSNFIGGLGLFD